LIALCRHAAITISEDQLDLAGAFSPGLVTVIAVFFFLALFDSVGTLVGVGEQAGLMRDGTLPRARQALLEDAIGTVAGAALGTSTVTAYIESGAAIAAGGRTELASLVTAAMFLLSLFLHPLVQMVRGGHASGGITLCPVIAPPLILVGTMMIGGLQHVGWDDPTEAIPRVPHARDDAARRQHHRGRGVRVAVVGGVEARNRSWTRGASAGLRFGDAVPGSVHLPAVDVMMQSCATLEGSAQVRSPERMDQQQLKDALLKKRGEILGTGGIKPLQASMENNTRQGDMADQASGNNEVHIQLKLKQTDAKILQAIEEALWRIDKGTYGVCRDCGEPIADARLKAIPWTRVCITCKEKQNA
jgi:RNA polymerase-binding protein DksA